MIVEGYFIQPLAMVNGINSNASDSGTLALVSRKYAYSCHP